MNDSNKGRIETTLFWSAALALTLLWAWRYLGMDPVGRMRLGVDFNHQFALLAWIHRSVFHGEGPLLSQPLFWPLQGVPATSELPLIPGVLFGLFRELGAPPVFAWNLLYGLACAGNAAAMYAAIRVEKASPAAAFVGALAYALSGWLGLFGDAIYYRCTFGPPLVWYLLSRMRDEGASSYAKHCVWLGVLLFVQLLCGATVLFAALIVLCVRLVADHELWHWRLWRGVAIAFLPALLLGLWWRRVSSAALDGLGLGDIIWLHAQLYFRLDLLNFLPVPTREHLINAASQWDRDPWLPRASLIPSLGHLLLSAIGLVGARKQFGAAPSQSLPPPRFPVYLLAALAGAVIVVVCGPLALRSVADNRTLIPQYTSSVLLWFLAVIGVYHSRRRGGFLFKPGTIPVTALWILLAAVLIAMGPMVFVFGSATFIGPTAVLDTLVSGFKRIRVPFKLLSAGAMALALLAALGVDQVAKAGGTIWARFRRIERNPRNEVVGARLFGVFVVGWFCVFNLPDWLGTPLQRSVALPEEACSGCGQGRLNTVPAPYAWLNENAPGEPILELPAGPSEMPVEGEPPLSGHDNTYQFYYALDGIPRVNGTTSWPPIPYLELLEELEEFPGPRSLAAIRSWGPVHWLVVHGDRYEAAQWARIEALLESPPEGLSLVRAWGPVRLYRLAAPGDS